jgi:hypothetical protein
MFRDIQSAGFSKALAGHADQRPKRVIVYGRYKPDWDKSLDVDAPVWRGMPGVQDVRRARTWGALMALGLGSGRPSIVLSLRERFIESCPPLWWGLSPSRRAFGICRDKQRFAEYCAAAGLSDLVPETYADRDDVHYPAVLKRTNKAGGYGVAIVDSRAQLQRLMRMKPWRHRRTIVQALLPGHVDHVTHCVALNGRIIWHCSYRYDLMESAPLQSSKTIVERSRHVAASAHIASLERFLLPLDYSGAVSFDYRLMPDGGVKVFEINPRFGGSLMRPENFEDMRAGLATLIAHAQPPRWALTRKVSQAAA